MNRMLDSLLRDVRYGARMLRKNPGFTALAVLTLALGIGANTAIFSVVDAILLRPLPYPAPDRLALIATRYRDNEFDGSQDGRTWEAIRDHAGFIEAAPDGGGWTGVNFVAHGQPEYVLQQRVGAGYFHVLGVSPLAGREFTREEDRPGGPAVVVLSYGLWRRAFQGDHSIIGRAVFLRGEPYTIVGVMPKGFRTSSPADLWTPLRPSTQGEGGGTNYEIVARLRPGVTWAQAGAQIAALGEALFRDRHLPAGIKPRLEPVPLQRGLTDDLRRPLFILWAAVGLVLLIGCINVAGLLLARARGRRREIATRMALGSGRAGVVRQLVAESLLLACGGGAAGVALGYAGLRALKVLGADTFGALKTVSMDGRVLAAAAVLSVLTVLLFGLAPALQASRLDLRSAMVEGGGRGIAGGSARWPRRLLVMGEVALGVVLLVGAGLLIRSFAHLNALAPGFDAGNVIAGKLSLQDVRYASAESANRLFERSLERIRQLPGVESAAVVLGLPYERLLNMGFKRFDGAEPSGRFQITNLSYATPELFRVLRIPLLRGRVFTEADTARSPAVAVVSQTFVKTYYRDRDPLGSFIELADARREIVGIVGDTQQRPGWGDFGPLAPTALVYIPASQTSGDFLKLVHTWFTADWVVRTSAPIQGTVAGMERAVRSVDPTLPFAEFQSLVEARAKSLGFQRLLMTLLSAMAGLALLLAAVGIYALIAHSVVERTHELGIRLALGATGARAARAVALPGIGLAAAGMALGCALAAASTGVLRHLIWGVKPGDPATFAVVAAVLFGVALAASVVPAVRVIRLDPARTLRDE